MSTNETPVAYERLETVTWERREWHPVGTTRDEIAACMAWVISRGHQAKSLEDDGFRYRSVYPNGDTSPWYWCEPGQFLMHMSGERQDNELDAPHDDAPEDASSWGLPGAGWIRVEPTRADQ
ncbi:hypothetical protein GCM10022215_24330 [Nocardioides fonticola]|uniref:DUF551 domain-containing protein n=1 Tax=Nocardioides fonticola TaxID=450363 RepID=A0ABP7XJW7_9ACTN